MDLTNDFFVISLMLNLDTYFHPFFIFACLPQVGKPAASRRWASVRQAAPSNLVKKES
jgi:hypothetical protein